MMRIFTDEFTISDAMNAYVRSALIYTERKGDPLSEKKALVEAQLAFLSIIHPRMLDSIRQELKQEFSSFDMIMLEQALEELHHAHGVESVPVRHEFVSDSTLDFFSLSWDVLTHRSIFYELANDCGSSTFSADEFDIATQDFCHEIIESLRLRRALKSGFPLFDDYAEILLSYRDAPEDIPQLTFEQRETPDHW